MSQPREHGHGVPQSEDMKMNVNMNAMEEKGADSSLKLLANVACQHQHSLQGKRRRKEYINNYLTKIRRNIKKNRALYSRESNRECDSDWFDDEATDDSHDDDSDGHGDGDQDDDDEDEDDEQKAKDLRNKNRNKKKERKERRLFKEQCLESMKEYDRMFYGLWCDENLLYSSDDNEQCTESASTRSPPPVQMARVDEAEDSDDNAVTLKWSPSALGLQAKDSFVNEVFDSKQMANHGVCVKVHSNILSISKRFLYHDEYFNHIYQDSQWDELAESGTKRRAKGAEHDDDDEDEEDEEDEDEEDEDEAKIGVDGWERIDDETFCLTKPHLFEKRVYLPSTDRERERERERRSKKRWHSDDDDESHSDDERMEPLWDGNVIKDGMAAFAARDSKDEQKEEEEEDEQEVKARDVWYSNGMEDPLRKKEAQSAWTKKDEKEMERQRRSRHNKSVEIMKKMGEPLKHNDVMGIGINFHSRTLFVTVNGELVNDKKYNEPLLFRDLFIKERLYIVGILKHFGNQLSFNFGQSRFRFDLSRYFGLEYVRMVQRNNNYFSRFLRSIQHSSVNKKLLNCSVLDHCIYEGFEVTANRMMVKLFGADNAQKLTSHLKASNEVWSSMTVRRCIKKCIESGSMLRAKENIKKLKIRHFSMKYPVAWFQILRQELVELMRTDHLEDARRFYQQHLLGFESRMLGLDDLDLQNKEALKAEVNVLGTVLANVCSAGHWKLDRVLLEYRYLFDVERRHRLRDIVHNLIYKHMKQREEKRMQCLYNHRPVTSIYDSQLNLMLRHLCAVYDCYNTNFANYCEHIRFV